MKAWLVLASAVIVSALIAAISACGESKASSDAADAASERGPYDDLVSIDVTPSTADLIAGDANGSQDFVATGSFVGGSTRDLTAVATWKGSADSVLAVSGPKATATGQRGGDATVAAFVGAVTGTAQVHVKWVRTVLAPGAAPGSEARFAGAAEDAALAPALAYPLSGVVIPPNLPQMEMQWKPAAGTDLFDVAVSGPNLDLHVITPCSAIGTTGACGLLSDATIWPAVTATLAGQDAATIEVRGAGATAGKIGTSAAASMQIAAEDLRGGLYYFNTKDVPPDVKPGIFRYDFATGKVGAFYTAGKCAGCHALSPDGTKMLASICTLERGDCGQPMQLAVVDVATREVVTPPMPVGDSFSQTWAPDNAFYVTTPQCKAYSAAAPFGCTEGGRGEMTLISGATNTLVATVPAGAGAGYPAFSTDGKKLVYARPGASRLLKAGIYWMTFDPAQNPPTFGPEQSLVASSNANWENNYHPSYSPDDKWVVFSRSHCYAGDDPSSSDINANPCDTYNDYTARSWVVSAAGGPPIEIARANGDGRNTVSWPRWAPFKTTYKGGELFWITVASTRDYGFRATHTRDGRGNPSSGVTQLWLVAFDPAKAAAGIDPSFAPLWLPFQDVTSSNHIGQWATRIVGAVN